MAVIKVKVWWRELHWHADLCSVQFPSANWRTKDQREEYFQTMEEEQKNVPLLKTLRPTPTPEKTKRQRQQNGNPPCFEYYTCMRLILWVNTRHISITSIIRILSITVCVPIICHSWLNRHYNKIWINHHFFAPKVHFLRLLGAKFQ